MGAGKAFRYMFVKDHALPLSIRSVGAAGYDLHSPIGIKILAGGNVTIRTGIAVEIPHGYCGYLTTSANRAWNHVTVEPIRIDSDYRGEICVLLRNHDILVPYHVIRNDVIAQLVIVPVLNGLTPVQVAKLSPGVGMIQG
jgi:deoxyuridine 5'-triphosphate nucleotidohydrolase